METATNFLVIAITNSLSVYLGSVMCPHKLQALQLVPTAGCGKKQLSLRNSAIPTLCTLSLLPLVFVEYIFFQEMLEAR